MSYISVMSVTSGIVMLSDRKSTRTVSGEKIGTLSNTVKKLYTVGDNICLCMAGVSKSNDGTDLYLLIDHFCRTQKFDKPKDCAEKLVYFLSDIVRKDTDLSNAGISSDCHILLAGYDKNEGLTPEIYELSLINNKKIFHGNYGFMNLTTHFYFKPFLEKLNSRINSFTLQDAVDVSKFAFNTCRKLWYYLDLQESISEEYEMVVLTPYELKWLKKLEVI